MNDGRSEFDQAWAATLIDAAEGVDHDGMARLYSIPRPRNFPESDWVNGLWTLAIGPRGTFVPTFRFVEACLRRFESQYTLEARSSSPARLYATVESGALPSSLLNRLIRAQDVVGGGRDKLYMVVFREETGAYVDLAPVQTAHWDRPDFSPLEADTKLIARALPFRFRENCGGPVLADSLPETETNLRYGGMNRLEILIMPGHVPATPPTYIQPAGAAERPAGEPFGGHIQRDASVIGMQTGSARRPLYLGRGRKLRSFENVLSTLLAAGNHVEIKGKDEIY